MPTISLHITEEELNQRIAEAATKASQQVAQALANDIMRVSLMSIPLEIDPDALLLITVDFSREARPDTIRKTMENIYDTFMTRGITRILVLASTDGARFSTSIIKQTDADAITGASATKTSYEYDGTTRLKQ